MRVSTTRLMAKFEGAKHIFRWEYFCFYYMFKQIFMGTKQFWLGTKKLGGALSLNFPLGYGPVYNWSSDAHNLYLTIPCKLAKL